jgi:hypothetical protein
MTYRELLEELQKMPEEHLDKVPVAFSYGLTHHEWLTIGPLMYGWDKEGKGPLPRNALAVVEPGYPVLTARKDAVPYPAVVKAECAECGPVSMVRARGKLEWHDKVCIHCGKDLKIEDKEE